MDILEFTVSIIAYCNALGASVTSWGRTTQRNAAVGGVKNSGHRFWLSVDVVYDNRPPEADRVTAAARLGLRVVVEDGHDHLQPLGWAPG